MKISQQTIIEGLAIAKRFGGIENLRALCDLYTSNGSPDLNRCEFVSPDSSRTPGYYWRGDFITKLKYINKTQPITKNAVSIGTAVTALQSKFFLVCSYNGSYIAIVDGTEIFPSFSKVKPIKAEWNIPRRRGLR